MKLCLMGPDDSGRWFLCDSQGRDWRIVEKWQDHPSAAALCGWVACACGKTDGTFDCDHRTADDMIEDARHFLMEHISEEVEAPRHIAEYFEQFHQQEVVTDFGNIRLRSAFEVVSEEPGRPHFRIEGPVFEFMTNDEPT